MHVARQTRDLHARLTRDGVPLEARAPQLIKLPISLPSIPILGPLLTPIIGGTNQAATTTPTPTTAPPAATTPTPAPTVTPAPTTSTTSGTDGSGSGGDNNTNSSNSDVNGGTSAAATSDASGTSAGSSPQPTDGSSTGGSSSDTTSSGSSSDSNSGGHMNVPVANAGGTGNSSGGSDSGNNSGTSGYVDGMPSNTGSGKGITGSTALSNPNGATSTGSSDPGNAGGGISAGAISGIVVVLVLILLVLAIILFRRRYMNQRAKRLNQWWAGAGNPRNSPVENATSPVSPTRSNNRASARSSFATTFDHAQTPRLSVAFGDIPPLPPMAEVRENHYDGFQLFSPNSAIADSPVLITFDGPQAPPVAYNRASVHSVGSNSSGAQYLDVPHDSNANSQEVTTPMSVRPFSPSESFAFPKPPSKQQSGEWSSSRPMSATTYHSVAHSPVESSAIAPEVPSNPFSDPVADPVAGPILPATEFAEVESVRRPFASTRDDELSVAISDSVRIIQLFDDGWALVEKLPSFEDVLAKDYTNAKGVQGLIPIDCFRAAGQDLPSFFSEKRVTSTLYDKRASSIFAVTAV
ncbi:hypothetical protein DXG01_013078 [Tephrocybe rancida]|nr:hypothetical protein DXG01_013078 [Tephrocybe rancida]